MKKHYLIVPDASEMSGSLYTLYTDEKGRVKCASHIAQVGLTPIHLVEDTYGEEPVDLDKMRREGLPVG